MAYDPTVEVDRVLARIGDPAARERMARRRLAVALERQAAAAETLLHEQRAPQPSSRSGANEFAGCVALPWLSNGVLLAEAWQAFGKSRYVEDAEAAAVRFAELRSGERPEGLLAHWTPPRTERYRQIADRLNGSDREAWNAYTMHRARAEFEVTTRLRHGTLLAFGAPQNPAAALEWIRASTWQYLQPDSDRDNVVRGENIAYWDVHVVDPALRPTTHASEPESVDASPEPQAPLEYRTGAEGRPTSRQLVEQEMLARAARGETKTTLAQETADLEAWLIRVHPSAPRMTAKTIANQTRGTYNRLRPKL